MPESLQPAHQAGAWPVLPLGLHALSLQSRQYVLQAAPAKDSSEVESRILAKIAALVAPERYRPAKHTPSGKVCTTKALMEPGLVSCLIAQPLDKRSLQGHFRKSHGGLHRTDIACMDLLLSS